MSKIKVLGIAPYESMKILMEDVSQSFPELDLKTYTGDLSDGANIAQEMGEKFDIIISRGGTAKRIRQISNIPVIDIALSGSDILRAMKLADTYGHSYAIVGFDSITKQAHILCELLNESKNIVEIRHESQVDSVLSDLKKNGIKLVLGDKVVTSSAKAHDLDSILITSGAESIEEAFQKAIGFCQSYLGLRTKLHILEDSFKNSSVFYMIFSASGNIIYSNFRSESAEEKKELTDKLKQELKHSFSEKKNKFFKTVHGKMYIICRTSFSEDEKDYILYEFWTNSFPITKGKKGIRFIAQSELRSIMSQSLFMSLYEHSVDSIIQHMNHHRSPIIIFGEEGTGKRPVASLIYSKSKLRNHLFIEIDCTLLNYRNWSYLFKHYNSPFTENGNTIYFHQINALSQTQRIELVNLMKDTNLCERNQIIMSYLLDSYEEIPDSAYHFINHFSCITTTLPPLRDHLEDIPKAVSLYLNKLNEELGKTFIGAEPEAMDLFENYTWPYNYCQLKRVLKEIAIQTDSIYIKADTVLKTLQKEKHGNKYRTNPSQWILNDGIHPKRLDEITKEIIQYTLNKNGGNQTLTAKQLGISRSTLWRYLKNK